MTQKKKTTLLATGLVVAGAAAAYVWFVRSNEVEMDGAVAALKQTYTCSKCGAKFDLTVGDASAMRRANGDVLCPKCGQSGAQKDGVMVRISGMEAAVGPARSSPEETYEVQTPEGKKQVSMPAGGVAPKSGS